ncbi:MAG TPA: HypC/HybG/HupF family hydrogenase formation chaperone [Desulfosalsimonadaceae bacterium]|nr:HypC/HybG/HupF family hydrogenase formation chaperone [Desulfosalsimonadaceae bacterium]
MCLAIPSKIIDIDTASNIATIDVEGVRRQASLMLVADARVGDYVIVHAGFVIQKLDEQSAQESLKLLREAFFSDTENSQ